MAAKVPQTHWGKGKIIFGQEQQALQSISCPPLLHIVPGHPQRISQHCTPGNVANGSSKMRKQQLDAKGTCERCEPGNTAPQITTTLLALSCHKVLAKPFCDKCTYPHPSCPSSAQATAAAAVLRRLLKYCTPIMAHNCMLHLLALAANMHGAAQQHSHQPCCMDSRTQCAVRKQALFADLTNPLSYASSNMHAFSRAHTTPNYSPMPVGLPTGLVTGQTDQPSPNSSNRTAT